MHSACYGISARAIAELCQVDLATARRWKAGTSRLPYSASCLLLRDLGAFSPYWRGFTIKDEDLISPDGWVINRNHALSVPLQEGLIQALHQKVKGLEAEVSYLKSVHALQDQPAPTEALPLIG